MKKRLVLWALGGLFSIEAFTATLLQIASIIRKKLRPEAPAPRLELPPTRVGEDLVQVFAFGADLYRAMLEAIDSATETIYLETFIWKDDEVGREFKRRLEAKAAQGVAVHLVYDEFGNLVVPPAFKRFDPRVEVMAYTGFHRPWHALDLRRYALEHRKLLIVDGRVGFVGGYNIGSAYATKWRDTHLRVEGPAAADLADEFVGFWNIHAFREKQITGHYPRRFNPLIRVEGTNAMHLTFPIRDMYLQAVDNAEMVIRLTNAYFVPDRVLVASLIAAAKRKVDVRILVPWISNHVVTDWLARGLFTQLLESGVRIFGYESMLHAKTCTIDGQWSTIGTANLDRLSSVGNYEVNVGIYSDAVARQMEQLFDQDIKHATEVKLAEWLARPWYAKLGERVLSPLRAIL